MSRFSANAFEQMLKSNPGMNVKVTSFGKTFLKALEQASKEPYVAVGITKEKFDEAKKTESGNETELTIGEIAVIHEFGSKDGITPERSFIRVPYVEKYNEMVKYIKELHSNVVKNKLAVKRALGLIGLKFETIIRDRIRSNIPPTLSDSALSKKSRAGKKGNVALIDTGQLLKTIGSAVVLNGRD